MSEFGVVVPLDGVAQLDAAASQLALEMDSDLFMAVLDREASLGVSGPDPVQAPVLEAPEVDTAIDAHGTLGQSASDPAVQLSFSNESAQAAADSSQEPELGIGQQIWKAFIQAEDGYHSIFPSSGQSSTGDLARSGDPEVLIRGTEIGGANATDLSQMLETSMKVSMWSVQVNLLSSGVKRTTDGVQTLFRNSG